MRLGYACINNRIPACGPKTFRLASYSDERMRETVACNLLNLEEILEWNRREGFQFFRISSGIVPFASHPVCRFPWQREFAARFASIGKFIRRHGMRVAMHPDQFTLINSTDEEIFGRSQAELLYHAEVLDLMGLNPSHKIQIHVGGVYGDRETSIRRFIERFRLLPREARRRLVIENDERLYPLADCLRISSETGLPVVLDVFHHALLNDGAGVAAAFTRFTPTWSSKDGPPIVDYSSQEPGKRFGSHAAAIDLADFERFLRQVEGFDFDLMLEIKDKEESALRAREVLRKLERLRVA